ncbi:MAG: DUF4115 domain-containing protein [Nitrococcus sp.]|nr:DUF4115 domain-containing protein [Nitrococcus sp.]
MATSEYLHAEAEIESLFKERRGPGLSLRQAREHCRLSVASIAGTLHLEQRVVEALEADDYSELPPLTYVRGYLSAYARLVNLPVADVLQSFDRVGLQERSRPLTFKVGGSADRRGVSGAFRGIVGGFPGIAGALRGIAGAFCGIAGAFRGIAGAFAGSTWLLVAAFTAVLISGLMFWTASQSTPEPAFQDENAQAGGAGATTASAAVPAIGEAPTKPGIELPALGEETPAMITELPASSPRSTLRAAPEATPGNAAEVPVETSQEDAPTTLSVANNAAEIAHQKSAGGIVTTGNPAAEPMPPQPATELAVIKVDASGESWVDVVDADSERLVYDLLERGDSRRATGRPPFDITIGNAAQVVLHQNGTRIDLAPYTQGNVARFTLTATRD